MKLRRNVGSRTSSGGAMSGPRAIPALSATRETLNASARCFVV